ncbi:MAG: cyclase family protein [Myxococcota bacterium]|nr:cyclase family protein [Myxococcota bacterium]
MQRTRRAAAAALPLLVATLPVPESGAEMPAPDPAAFEIVDLTHTYDEDTVYWPTSPSAFELTVLADGATEGGYHYRANRLCTPEHGGTHLDAPSHFAKEGLDAAGVPLRDLIGPAVVLDVTDEAAKDPDYRLTVERVEAFEARHGRIPRGAIVALRTGWSARWPDAAAYLGDDTPGDASSLHFPSYGAEAARLLVEARGVAVLGVDTASIDRGASEDFLVHRVAAAADVPGLENLTRLDRLPPVGAWIVALPMKIAGGSGGPARVVALVPR